MLLQFTVGNYRSFREKTTFSLIAEPKERGHENSLLDSQKAAGVKAVSLGVLYGANASGKSNLLKAMATLRDLVTRGVAPHEPVPVDRFLLDGTSFADAEPTFFEIYFVDGEEMYCYGLECDVRQIRREWLRYGQDEKPLFDRRTDANGTVTIENYDELATRSETKPERLAFVAEGTRENQTFHYQGVSQNVSFLTKIWEWFWWEWNVVTPGSHNISSSDFSALVDFNHSPTFLKDLSDFLRFADTGIEQVIAKDEPFDVRQLPDFVQRKITGDPIFLLGNYISVNVNGEIWKIKVDDSGNFIRQKLVATHRSKSAIGTTLDWSNESDGTRRIAELWQVVFMPNVPQTFVFDEIEHSLHPELVRFLLEQWRKNQSGGQLIFTTHNDNFLEDDLLRRDEVWFVSKDRTGASRMVSEVQYKPIEGVTRQRAYLDGMYGGVPNITERYFHHNPPDSADKGGIK